MTLFQTLAENPFPTGTMKLADNRGRTVELLEMDGVRVTYWVDHAVREVRIVDVEQA